MFLKDCWYVAAWGSELGAVPWARTICGEPIVLFRSGQCNEVAGQSQVPPDAPTVDINVDVPALAMRRLVAQHRA